MTVSSAMAAMTACLAALGNDGNDLFNGGAGNDAVYGGSGTDTAVFSGNSSAYTVVAVGGGFRVTGPDGTDTVMGVEQLRFSDGTFAPADLIESDDPPAQPATTTETSDTTPDDPNTGTAGADNLIGGNTSDTIEAYGGNDRVVGMGGNDSLFGGSGNDELVGNNGNDVINGGANNDAIYGGAGTDKAVFSGNSASYTVVAVGGGYRVSGPDGTDTVLGVEQFQFANGTFTPAQLVGGTTPAPAPTSEPATPTTTTTTQVSGTVRGTTSDDNFVGGAGNDVFHTSGGNDRAVGNAGNDAFYGGAGNDHFTGNTGNDVFHGGAGNDQLFGGGGTDTAIFTGRTTDYTIVASGDGHRITGVDGTDTIQGIETLRFRDDTLSLSEYLAQVNGTPSQADTAEETASAAPVGNGASNDEGGIAVSLQGDLVRSERSGSDLDIAEASGNGFKGVNIIAVDSNSDLKAALGGQGNEAYVIYEDGARATINGKSIAADEWTTQFNRIDPDAPAISGSALNTALQLGSVITDSWRITATDKNDTISGLSRGEVIDGARGSDKIEGNGGWDHIFGGNGWDQIEGGRGQDKLYGGDGRDTFIISAGDDTDTIFDLEAGDRLAIEGFDFKSVFQVKSQLETRADCTSFLDLGDGDGFILSGDSVRSLDDVDIILG